MAMYPGIKVQQPEPFDIVDQRVLVAGVGTGFEATIDLRVRDGNAAQLARTFVNTGGTGVLGNFQAAVDLPGAPPTAEGFVEVFDADGDDVPGNLVVVPVVFGENLVPSYYGFSLRTVVPDDTLSGIAQEAYGDASLYLNIFAANRNQVSDPNRIFAGQQLRVPQGNQF